MPKINRRHYKVEKLRCKDLVDKMLSGGYTYDDIVAAVADSGETLSTSALQRYNASFEFAAEKIRRVKEQAKVLIDALKDNPGTELAEVANQVMMSGLLERIAGASDEFDNLSLEAAGRLIASLERSATGRERLKLQFDKMLTTAGQKIKDQLKAELADLPDVQEKLAVQVDKILQEIAEEK